MSLGRTAPHGAACGHAGGAAGAAPPAPGATPALRKLPVVAVLATGGTIAGVAPDAATSAGYQAGVVGVEQLLAAVPALGGVAQVHAEQIANVDSKDMTTALWLTLARRVNEVLAQPDVDGVVISHGTDTLEETAYWLHLTVRHAKPVVLVAAMRPSTALSADGPLNLLNAVTLAAHAGAAGKGVLVTLANRIHSARDVTKTSTYAIDAFQSPDVGQLGWVQDGRVEFQRAPLRAHTTASEFSGGSAGGCAVVSARDGDASERTALPAVEIVLSYAGVTRTAIDALVAAGVRGLVVAGTGNGSLHATLQHALAEAVKRGVVVVRASRVGCGHVMRDAAAPDTALGFVSAGSLNPYKARVLLMLALAGGLSSPADVQRVFDTY